MLSASSSRQGMRVARGQSTLIPSVRPASFRSSCRAPARLVTAAAGKVQKVNGEELEVFIQERDRPLIVDFFATWCGPCVLLAKELEEVAETLGDEVRVLKLDVDENQQLSSQLRIEGLPTMVFIPKDATKPALRTEGLMKAVQIIEIVRKELS
mmetsp:Transcript_19083/g.32711  ORF Transcript_19083/g.32711 Transcript_19083/m.32711 type:complete len:154 (-) Transcript_19083:634-1095(-)